MLAHIVLLLALAGGDRYAPLRMFDGSWESVGATKDQLTDRCTLLTNDFVCEQTVNGKPGALLVFIPADKPDTFITENVLPDGGATGRGELRIEGNRWTFSSTHEADGKKFYSHTINVFTGTDHIHSESAKSEDGEHWTVIRSGDLVRVKR